MVGYPERTRFAAAIVAGILPVFASVASCAQVIGLDGIDRVPCVGDCDAGIDVVVSDAKRDAPRPTDTGRPEDSSVDRKPGDASVDRKPVSCATPMDCPFHEACDPKTGKCTTSCSSIQTCHGGCCDGKQCAPGTKATACGQGALCVSCFGDPSGDRCTASGVCGCDVAADCPVNQACDTTIHACTTACSATQLCRGGCCSSGSCAVGTSTMACGNTGGACASCGSGQECSTGSCVCDAVSCPNGCCNGGGAGTCEAWASQSMGSCGSGGIACAPCGSGDICNGYGACVLAPPEVVPFLVAGLTGTWGTTGCSTTTELGTTTSGAVVSATWTDTTGDASPSQITLGLAWKFFCSGASYSVTVNGALLGGGTAPAISCACNTSAFQTTTQTFTSGYTINPFGSNTLTVTETGSGYLGIMDNGSWALEVTVTP